MKLAFYKGTKAENPQAKLFDRAVCAWTGGRFSHCELVISGSLDQAVCWSSSQRDGGVRCKNIDLNTGRWEIVEIPPSFDGLAAVSWFIKHEGEPYDTAGLFGFILPWRTENKRKWFCSESCAAALGIGKHWAIHPNELFLLTE
jgi:endogenous inhibitor of DNA gyrase (YacG/DUF329 family)